MDTTTPSSQTNHILVIEDDPLQAEHTKDTLALHGWESLIADTGSKALEILHTQAPSVILLDVYLPDINGLDLLKKIKALEQQTAVIIMTGHSSINLAVEAMRYGAYDFLEKPMNTDRILITVKNAFTHLELIDAVNELKTDLAHKKCENIIGTSLPMMSVFRMIETAASSNATVFITGESGTGKELCAEALHQQSPRRQKPFIALNCAAIPKELMESEIFGHVKGAFTNAYQNREGAASRADGGTLFLDEICEMDLELQSKLLRFFQTQRFQKVGGSEEISVDIRFICATNKNPLELVRRGLFREDLYYRLHVVPIHIPPLRERGADILLITKHLLKKYSAEENKHFSSISPEAEQLILSHAWPGNVRELQNVIRNIVVLNDGEQITPHMLPFPLNTQPPMPHLHRATQQSQLPNNIKPLWQVEMEAIEEAINLCDGNIHKAADLLDINPSTIYRKRKKWLS